MVDKNDKRVHGMGEGVPRWKSAASLIDIKQYKTKAAVFQNFLWDKTNLRN